MLKELVDVPTAAERRREGGGREEGEREGIEWHKKGGVNYSYNTAANLPV